MDDPTLGVGEVHEVAEVPCGQGQRVGVIREWPPDDAFDELIELGEILTGIDAIGFAGVPGPGRGGFVSRGCARRVDGVVRCAQGGIGAPHRINGFVGRSRKTHHQTSGTLAKGDAHLGHVVGRGREVDPPGDVLRLALPGVGVSSSDDLVARTNDGSHRLAVRPRRACKPFDRRAQIRGRLLHKTLDASLDLLLAQANRLPRRQRLGIADGTVSGGHGGARQVEDSPIGSRRALGATARRDLELGVRGDRVGRHGGADRGVEDLGRRPAKAAPGEVPAAADGDETDDEQRGGKAARLIRVATDCDVEG